MTELANDQAQAFDRIMHWLNPEHDEGQFFILGGYAGTGKTFLMQHLANNYEGTVICATPTGKAADVLKSKMPSRIKVSTIHHLLYSPVDSSTTAKIARLQYQIETADDDTSKLQKILKRLQAKLEEEGDEEDVEFMDAPHEVLASRPLIIVDESSMVTMKMFNDFINTGCRLLFVGDPFQLPPVNVNDSAENRSIFDVHGAHFELTEIKRQALESPIIRIAHAIRHGENPAKHFDSKLATKVSRDRIRPEHYLRADQVICGTNKTRYAINRAARLELNHSNPMMGAELPVAGDKLICTMNKNNYTWINGVIHEAVSSLEEGEFGNPVMDVLYQDELRENIEVYDYNFRCNYDDPKMLGQYKITDWREKMELIELDYAYGITCHKSQGSEWDKVLVIQDWFFGDNERWLYTAVTRAKEKLLWAA